MVTKALSRNDSTVRAGYVQETERTRVELALLNYALSVPV